MFKFHNARGGLYLGRVGETPGGRRPSLADGKSYPTWGW